jgi:2,3-diketo-5-methylthio-1-phosphopentane phosphatase
MISRSFFQNERGLDGGRLPPAEAAQVWIDFDGTLSEIDVLDGVVRRFARDESWREIERLWKAGAIGSRQCIERELALVEVSDEQLMAFLDSIGLDRGAVELVQLLDRWNVPVTVLSDGIDLFIRHILGRHGLGRLPVRSNTIVRRGKGMELRCPFHNSECPSAAAHCKCASAQALGQPGRRSIYIGDGRSDLCAARRADFVFAKGNLAELLKGEGIAFAGFETLADVECVLSKAWGQRDADGPG